MHIIVGAFAAAAVSLISGGSQLSRTFDLSSADRDKLHMQGRAYLEVDSASGVETIFNSVKIDSLSRAGRCDVTDILAKGQNSLVVKGAGLRDARLVVCPHAHPLPGSITVTAKEISAGEFEISASYMTLWGREIKRWKLSRPDLWTPLKPRLYTFDIYGHTVSYGVRSLGKVENGTLFLNGKAMKIKGVDFDCSLYPLCGLWDESALKRHIAAMKAHGVNMLRVSRVTPPLALSRLCDEAGILYFDASKGKTVSCADTLSSPSDVTAAFLSLGKTECDALFPPWRLDTAVSSGEVKPRTSSSRLTLCVDPYQPYEPGALRFLQLRISDKDGGRCDSSGVKVDIRVEGDGEYVASGAFDGEGKALVLVRRTGEGVITVTASADGLKAADCRLGALIHAGAGESGLERAREEARKAKSLQPGEPVIVVVPAIEYRLSKPWRFDAADSGRPDAPVIWKGNGASVRGGIDIGPWKNESDGVVSSPVPRNKDGSLVAIDMLFVNGKRASRSVFPKKRGSFSIPGGIDDSRFELVSTNEKGWVTYAREFTRVDEAAAAVLNAVDPSELRDVQMQLRHDWTQARRRIVGWDAEKREVITECFGGKSRANDRWTNRAGLRFENVRGAFVDEGDWFYDRKNAKVLYRLRPGETAASLKGVIPEKGHTKLLSVSGASDIIFEGFSFLYSDAPQGGVSDDWRKNNQTYQSQSAKTYDATVELEYAKRVEFRKCRVAHTGNHAFRIRNGCRNVALRRCETWDTGAGGIWIGSDKMYPTHGKLRRAILRATDPESCAFIVVEDCRLRHGGRFDPEGTAVFITHASDCRIEHNEIDDWFYSGVTVGYTWGYDGSTAQRNVVAFNRITRLGQGELSDMGGIYTLATSFGTVVSNNVVSQIYGFKSAAWGLYADEGSEGIVFENNIVSHTENGGINQHYGSGCVFRNNIVAYNDTRGCLSTARREAMNVPSSLHIVGNIFYTRKGPLICRGATRVDGVWAHNLWWKEGGCAADDFDLVSAEEYLASGRGVGDVVADPLFVDPENGDFRLRKDSPALKLGFKQWDYSLVGPRAE